jgi:uncharacterized protein YbjT (DUF2867 family)
VRTDSIHKGETVRVLVTGATGNVGRLVVNHLLQTGVQVRALTNNPEKAALPPGVVRAAYGGAAYAPLDLDDIATVAAKVLLEDGHHGKKYAMTGPESLSKVEKVQIIGEVLGHPQTVLSTVPDLLGRPATTFRAWVQAHADAFR